MPKREIDYSKTVIYKIVCNDLTVKDCYVGSTTDFRKRKTQHKHSCICSNEKNNLKVYNFIRDNGGWDNWTMVLVEEYPCDTSLKAHARERHYIEQLNANLNKNIPTRTRTERRQNPNSNDALYDKEYRKKYYKVNVEKRKIKEHCICGSI
jgi:hypothetical protein